MNIRKQKGPTALMRIRHVTYRAIKAISAIQLKPMTDIVDEIMVPELKRSNLFSEEVWEQTTLDTTKPVLTTAVDTLKTKAENQNNPAVPISDKTA